MAKRRGVHTKKGIQMLHQVINREKIRKDFLKTCPIGSILKLKRVDQDEVREFLFKNNQVDDLVYAIKDLECNTLDLASSWKSKGKSSVLIGGIHWKYVSRSKPNIGELKSVNSISKVTDQSKVRRLYR